MGWEISQFFSSNPVTSDHRYAVDIIKFFLIKATTVNCEVISSVHTPIMECRPAPSRGNVKIRTRRFMPRKVLNRAFLNQKRGSEGHIPLKLCLRGCVFLGILSKVGYVSRNWKSPLIEMEYSQISSAGSPFSRLIANMYFADHFKSTYFSGCYFYS